MRTAYKSTHPWINKRCKEVVEEKRQAEGAPFYGDKLKACSEVILEEFNMYVTRTREGMQKLPRGSKRWWTMAKKLATRADKNSNIPPLKTSDKEWVMDAESKANLFLKTFTGKYSFIPAEYNEYSHVEPIVERTSNFLPIRSRHAREVLKT